ncbi:MAG: hypothetical protein ACJ72N_26795 [Labedaea sp.]
MTDIATLQMLPVDVEDDGLTRCAFTTSTICGAFTCNGAGSSTRILQFVFETDK